MALRRPSLSAAAGALVLVVVTACGSAAANPAGTATRGGGVPEPQRAMAPLVAAPAGDATPEEQVDVLSLLSTLVVEAQHLTAPAFGRDQWVHWLDVDGDGCDTRDEVLVAEAVAAPRTSGGCDADGGAWRSIYDGEVGDDPSTFDVDHLVPLAEAHRSGGWSWDAERKTAYANDLGDPRTLVAVSASSNRAKGDRDPAGWLPEVDVCEYVGDWVAVKARWSLSVDAEEATELSDLLVGPCAGATTALVVPVPVAAPAAVTTIAASVDPVAAVYANCAAVRVAGADPIHRGDAGYSHELDADDDGIACE